MSVDPVVTVLMPLYNGAPFVQQSVESILTQSFRDFEFLIIDDGSSDDGPEIVAGIEDKRIVLGRKPHNMGVAATLNRGLAMARGKYVARMDADDISLPDRLERQVLFMDSHPEVGISGGWVRFFGEGPAYSLRHPCPPASLRCYALFENPLCHMTVIMRRDMVETHRLRYDGRYSRSEDYELWSRALQLFQLANLDRILVRARQHHASATLANWPEMALQTEQIQAKLLETLGITPSQEERRLHHQVGRGYRQEKLSQIQAGEQWLSHLSRCNGISGFANTRVFRDVVGRIWFRFCVNSAPLGWSVWRFWRSSPLSVGYTPSLPERLLFMASIELHLGDSG